MTVRDLLLSLVKCSLNGEAIDIYATEKFLSDSKLATLFKVAKKHDVAHLVCYALEKNGFCYEDSDTWQLFLKEMEQAHLRYEMIQADINEIFSCFEGEGVDYVPLKGAVVRTLYPEPWMRTSCDIDILVRKSELERAVGALVEKLKYKTDGKKTYHDVSLYSPFGMHLELHYNIKENEPRYDKLLTRVWEFSNKTEKNSCKYLQSNEFLAFHLIAHAAYHFANGGCGMRSVLDLWLLKNRLDIDMAMLESLLEGAGLKTFFEAVLALGEYWFGELNSVSDTILEMERFILLGGAYGTDKQGAVSRQVKKGGKLKYFWSRVFMSYENLAVLYPVIKRHKILTPFCQVARWVGAIFKGKKVAKEIKNVASVDTSRATETKCLFDSLGL